MFSKKSSSTQEKGHGFHQAPKSEKKGKKTVTKVNYDVGFPNVLYMRGNGGNLNWERGVPLTNVKADEWVWETDLDFTEGEFKVLNRATSRFDRGKSSLEVWGKHQLFSSVLSI